MKAPPTRDRARMPFFRLLGAADLGSFFESSAKRSVADADKVIWSASPGSLAIEAWFTGLLAAFTGWDLVALALMSGGLSIFWACVIAVPVAFVAFHVAAAVASSAVDVLLGHPRDPMAWVHRFLMVGLTAFSLTAAASCPGVWPWIGWMALNLVAWGVLEISGLIRALAKLSAE